EIAGSQRTIADHDAMREHSLAEVIATAGKTGGIAIGLIDFADLGQNEDPVASIHRHSTHALHQSDRQILIRSEGEVYSASVQMRNIPCDLGRLKPVAQIDSEGDCSEKHRNQDDDHDPELDHGIALF